jgi:thioredoxin-related protein
MKKLFLLFTLGMASCMPQPPEIKLKDPKAIPPIVVLMSDTVTKKPINSVITKGKPTLFLFYSQACLYCDTMVMRLTDSIDMVKDINLVTLSAGMFYMVDNYEKRFQLSKFANVKNGMDWDNALYKYYGANGLPFMAFYDASGKVVRGHLGPLPMDSVVEIINKKAS